MPGTVCICLVAAIATKCMLLVVDAKDVLAAQLPQDEGQALQYGDLGAKALGRYGAIIINSSLVITQAGFSIAYLMCARTMVWCPFGAS